MGGEKIRNAHPERGFLGSPPRGRGKGGDVACSGRGDGITPAWAGKSCQSAAESAPGWDHPRVGGEKLSVCPMSLDMGQDHPRVGGEK